MTRTRNVTSIPIKPLEVVKYGHPALRSKGKKIEKIDDSVLTLASEMILTMYEEDGCGLAAQQVGRALQLAVIDVMPALEDRPSRLLSRAVQHEVDHLHGILFIDHLPPESLKEHQPLLRKFQSQVSF